MKNSEVKRISVGLYRMFWVEGGQSPAAVYNDRDGGKWFAPVNWVSGPSCNWGAVERVEEIHPDAEAIDNLASAIREWIAFAGNERDE